MEEEKRIAILVSAVQRTADVPECERSLDELERLLSTAGGEAYARVIQVKDTYNPRTVIGSGKVLEIKQLCESAEVNLVVFDFELTPMQIRNLEDDLGGVNVIDRSMLILDIFALHATSGEGKLQVELAQLKYTAPRLIGKGAELSRQGGGIGTRGPGETKLETDRRHLREKIAALEDKLKSIEHNRNVMRAARDRSRMAKIAVVGYTNAGKSTLMNALTGAGVLAEDKLFATLDPTTRQLQLPLGETVLMTDTVGFIRKLPHHLVEAFKSTLDEIRYADIILVVSDATDPEVVEHLEVTEGLIEELGAADKPRIYVYNKCDRESEALFAPEKEKTARISAKTGMGVPQLLELIEKTVAESKKEYELLVPYSEQGAVSMLYKNATVFTVEYRDDGVYVRAMLDAAVLGQVRKYII